MKEVILPHKDPLKFAKHILEKEEKWAKVSLQFPITPSLAMLVEAAAQSSASFRKDNSEKAFLVSLKNIKLLVSPCGNAFVVKVVDEHRLENLRYVAFEIFEENIIIANGTLVIAVQ